MEFFFNPRGIALIGATSNPRKGGFSILNNLMTGFKGGIYPVNPRYGEISGVKCYPSVKDVPDPVDLAIVFVPGGLVPEVIRACADRGIKGVMIESGGFAETGPDGARLQAETLAIAKETGIRLWGPNCMGLVDAKRRHVFSFVSPTIWDEGLAVGRMSMVVQSGMLSGAFLIDIMTHGVMGISKVCSVGNKMDVDECDLLEYLADDPDTGVIGLYLESIGDGRRFLELCRCCPKPVIALKGGKSVRGARAAMSHTASLAGNAAVISGALAQAGVVEATDFKQMMDIGRTLAAFPDHQAGRPGRMAVLTYSGGAGIISADFMEKMGLPLADLSAETMGKLKSVFPDWMPVSNPVDLWPAVERNGAEVTYRTAVAAACDDPGVDGIFIHAFTGGFALNPDIPGLIELARKAGKPIFCWLLGKRQEARQLRMQCHELGMPVFGEIGRAVECIDALFKRHPAPPAPSVATPDLSEKASELLNHAGTLDEHLSKRVLEACAIPVIPERRATDAAAAAEAAEELGFPVVIKGLSSAMIHKTEHGLVRLGIQSADEARAVYNELMAAMAAATGATGGGDAAALIQKQAPAGLELIVGLNRDPQFGPCVMLGIGGVMAEAIADVAFAVAPLSREDALGLIDRLRSKKLLAGFRGAAPVDREALADILTRLGDLGMAAPRVREVDINPLIVVEGKPVAVDATVILE